MLSSPAGFALSQLTISASVGHALAAKQRVRSTTPPLDLARAGVFAVGMDRTDTLKQVVQTLELERAGANTGATVWKPSVDFIPAVPKASINLEMLIDLKVVSRWVLMPMNSTIGAFGLSGRSGQDKFTVACALTHRRAWEQMVDQNLSAAIIFEDDAYYALSLHNSTPRPIIPPTEALRRTLTAVSAVDPDWEYINLGRCYDFCTQTYKTSGPAGEQHIAETGQTIIKSPSSLCTHAYAISLTGARKMLSLSLPHVFSIDILLSLLFRMGLLRQYSVSPPTFTQAKTTLAAEDRHRAAGKLLECEPAEGWVFNNCLPDGSPVETDRNALAALGGAWISQYGPAAQDCPTAYGKIADNQKEYVAEECSLAEFECEFVSSESSSIPKSPTEHRDAAALLKQMDELDLRGAIVWSLRAHDRTIRHSHAFVHRALHANLEYAFSQSSKPRHLCWARGDALPDGCSLGKLLGYEKDDGAADTSKGSILGRSLVFASPKHMAWSRDRALTNLPVDTHSAYIFHELMPPRFAPAMRAGRVVQWIVSGPDGNRPYLDSANYVARSSALVSECGNWPPCIRAGTPDKPATFVSAWASTLTPAEIEAEAANLTAAAADRAQRKTVNFVGSIWEGNWENFCDFTAGCYDAGVPFVRSGVNEVNPALVTCARDNPKRFIDDPRPVLDDDERFKLMAISSFSPAFQGSDHLRTDRPELSYFADRAFDSAALGQVVATNNPAVMQLLSAVSPEPLVFSPNISNLCGLAASRARSVPISALHKLQSFISTDHTYVTRLNAILKMFKLLPPAASTNTLVIQATSAESAARAAAAASAAAAEAATDPVAAAAAVKAAAVALQAAEAAAAVARDASKAAASGALQDSRDDKAWCKNYHNILDPKSFHAHRQRLFRSTMRIVKLQNVPNSTMITKEEEETCRQTKRASYCLWELRKQRCVQMAHDGQLDMLDAYEKLRCVVICQSRQSLCFPEESFLT